jgi:hypothetical protein
MEANPVFDAIGLKHTDRNADYSTETSASGAKR